MALLTVYGGVIVGTAVVVTSPLLLALVLTRRWTSRTICSVMLGVAYACAAAYAIYNFEWYDGPWRHGGPSVTYLLKGFGPPLLVAGAVGAWLGRLIERNRRGLDSTN
jgi:hypothetical protein